MTKSETRKIGAHIESDLDQLKSDLEANWFSEQLAQQEAEREETNRLARNIAHNQAMNNDDTLEHIFPY